MRILTVLIFGIMFLALRGEERISSVGERITKERKVDAEIGAEKTGNWVLITRSVAKVKGSAEGTLPHGAMTAITFSNDHGGIIDKHFPFLYYKNPVSAKVKLPLKLDPEIFTQYNQLSCYVYPDAADRAAVWFEVQGSKVWTQSIWPLIPRQWNKISICWSNHTPEQAREINSLILTRPMAGKLPGDPDSTVFYFKDFTLENVVTAGEFDWNAGREKIAVSQTGFSPGEAKQAILNGEHPADDFALLQNGKTVWQGTLIPVKTSSGEYKIADFSAWKTAGTYQVASGNLISTPFAVGYDYLNELAAKTRYYFWCVRSGTKTPAHAECFMDDGVRDDNHQPIDTSGGWFDASDLRGYYAMSIKTVMRPLAMLQDYNLGKDPQETQPSVFDEMLWGAKLLNKIWNPDNNMPIMVATNGGSVRAHPDPKIQELWPPSKSKHFFKINSYWTDNVRGTKDDRPVHMAQTAGFLTASDGLTNHWGIISAGLHFYLAAQESHPELAEAILVKCRRHFELVSDPDKVLDKEYLAGLGIGYTYSKSSASLGYLWDINLALWRITGEEKYRAAAFDLSRAILERQELRLFRAADGSMFGGFFQNGMRGKSSRGEFRRDDVNIYNFCRMIELFPDHEQFYRYHAVLRIYADFCLKNSNFTSRPYNMPYNWLEYGKPEEDCYAPVIGRADDGTEVFGSVRGKFTSGDIGNIAANGQFAAIALKDPELQYFASRALRYYTGENQAAISMVAEVGAHYRKDIMSTMIGWIPGMMSNPDMRKNRIPTVPYHRHHASNEIYTQTQGWYATAAILLASPAALTLELKNIPADCMLTVHDLACDREVQKNPASERIELQLPGGALYRFSFGNSIEFTGYLLSGEKCVMPLDLNNFAFVGEIKVPGEVKAGEKFTVEVTLNGRGKARPVIAGQNLKFDSQFEERELPAVFRFEATAEKSGSPYVVMVHPEGKRRLLKSAAGVVTK